MGMISGEGSMSGIYEGVTYPSFLERFLTPVGRRHCKLCYIG